MARGNVLLFEECFGSISSRWPALVLLIVDLGDRSPCRLSRGFPQNARRRFFSGKCGQYLICRVGQVDPRAGRVARRDFTAVLS